MKQLLLIFTMIFMAFTTQTDVYKDIPPKNQKFINFLEKHGERLAPTYNEANCVEFLDKALCEFIPGGIDDMTSHKIYIKHDVETVLKLIKRGDSTVVSGVCWALVSCNKAKWVKTNEVKKGDIVQYWTVDSGFINGHCGVIYGEDKTGYLLYSSHPDSKGFGVMSVNNKSQFPNTKFYIVRLK